MGKREKEGERESVCVNEGETYRDSTEKEREREREGDYTGSSFQKV